MKKILFILLMLLSMNIFASDLTTGLVIGMASGHSISGNNLTNQTIIQYRLNDGTIFIWSRSMPNTVFKYSDSNEEVFMCRHSERIFNRSAKLNLISIIDGKKEYIVFSFDKDGIQVGTEFRSDKPKTYTASKVGFVFLVIAGIIGLATLLVWLGDRDSDDDDNDNIDDDEGE